MSINFIKKTFLLIILFSAFTNSQNLKILKDSVFIDNSYFKLQELKITSKNELVKNKIPNWHSLQTSAYLPYKSKS